MPCGGPQIADYTYHTPSSDADNDTKFLMFRGYDEERAKSTLILWRFFASLMGPNASAQISLVERRPLYPCDFQEARGKSTKHNVDLGSAVILVQKGRGGSSWGVPLRISNIIWKGPQKSERLNSWWLTRLITLNASTLKSLRMKVTPNNRESDVDLRRSEKPHSLPNLALPNLREFVVYWVADPYGIMQVYYLLRAARY
ncbi:hypothetical protein TWF569_002958 [Orbilia oligospora]|nr:hypothetical protein TWF569_002958 [Orbilia oligospora]